MGLKGTLEDISIVDLVQYPHGGRRTGELVISAGNREVHLHYIKGALVHAALENIEGFDALVEIVDWKEAEFEFSTGNDCKKRTIKGHLIHTVMEAIRVADERRRDRGQQKNEAEEMRRLQTKLGASGDADPRLFGPLAKFIGGNHFALHASVIENGGLVLAEASRAGKHPRKIEALREALLALAKQYPRTGLDRVCLEDPQGTVVMVRLENGRALVAVSSRGAPLGAVFGSVNRLLGNLQTSE